jgi:AAA domain
MSFAFKPAVRENVSLLVGLAGGTGSGKTFTAMRLASGIAGDKPFALIDTAAGRGKHYADRFRFDHGDLHAPFRPEAYTEAILAADKAGYPVIVVDSMSHVWAGDGGVLDWQEEELTRMAGDDWKKREAVKMAAWIKPKTSHKRMVQRLLQVRAHLILCFRAEEKVDMIREDGKMKIVPKKSLVGLDGWIPICEKNLPFELTTSFLLTAVAPGVPRPIKLQEQHRSLFPLEREITEESGQRLAQWAAGGKTPDRPGPTSTPAVAQQSEATQRPARTQRHESMVADFEILARDGGREAFVEAWERLEKDDRAAIGRAERDRIAALGDATDKAKEKPA